MPSETKVSVAVTVEDFEVTSPASEDDGLRGALIEAADEIASSIGSALSSIGTSALHGRVTVTVDGVTGASDDEYEEVHW